MGNRQIVSHLRMIFGAKLRSINADILSRWISYFQSHPVVVSQKSAMVFSPHQDDETLGCGGMIALKRSLGVPVEVVFLTDGRYGRPEWITPETIIEIRQQEAVNALNILGVASSGIHFINQLDGSLQHLPHDQRQHVVNQLVQRLQSFTPGEIYVPHKKDVHGDHEATYKLVQEAIAASGIQVELLQYPIWMLWQNPMSFNLKFEDTSNAYRLAIDSVRDRKKQAIESYISQMSGLPKGFLNRFFLPYEIFFRENF
ncbi:MAG: PIG-L family deacetylase [Chroococcidiopsidaceae cyanobacterium CP_BM_RX_35]|nr:PIG-L family deacetylase [Chroococcidiopsidaceae cyanobacterium CP_BM_RX_35]